MGIFFGDVIAMLKEDVGAKQRGKISVKDSGHQIQVWKDYPYIYAGNLFSVKWNNLNFWGWVGCYFSPNGPVLELHTGNNGKRPKWEVVDRVLKSNGFQYDEEEKDYDSYFRGLSSKLNVPSKGRNSAKGLAVEIGDILTKVLSKLQRVK